MLLTVILVLISLPLQIHMVNTKNGPNKEQEDGFCAHSALEDDGDTNICDKDIKERRISVLQNNYAFADKLKAQNANDIFEFLDKNEDGWLDQEEFLPLLSGGDISKRTSVQIQNIYFLFGKLNDESIDVDEFKSFLENGIKIMQPKEFHTFRLRLLSCNLISYLNANNLVTMLEKFDADKNDVLDKDEQFNAAETILGLPREDISWQNMSISLEKLTKSFKEVQYLDHSKILRWTNSLIFHTLNAHYESYYKNMLIGSDKNEDGYLTLVEIVSTFSFLACVENWPIYELIASDQMNFLKSCHGHEDITLELHKLEVDINWNAFTSRNSDSFTETHEELWKLADTDSNGYVTLEEQSVLLKVLDADDSKLETRIEEILTEIDGNNDKVATIHELHQYFESQLWKNDHLSSNYESWLRNLENDDNLRNKVPTHVYQIFKIFDEDLNGKINFKELRLTREIQNFYLRTLWIDLILKNIDDDGDTRISLKEFQKLNSFRKFMLPSDICPDREINENYQQLFGKIDLTTDGYISKDEMFEIVKLLSNANNDEHDQKDINDYRLCAIEELPEDICSLIWHEFLKVMKQHGNEKLDSAAAEKDFLRWDTNKDKWVNFTEYSEIFQEYEHWSFDAVAFLDWLKIWLEGKPAYYTKEFLEDFKKQDDNNDGIISKGEIIAILQNHRKNYYTDERVNAKFSRSDRNEDGSISMAEYYLLTLLKVRRQ